MTRGNIIQIILKSNEGQELVVIHSSSYIRLLGARCY